MDEGWYYCIEHKTVQPIWPPRRWFAVKGASDWRDVAGRAHPAGGYTIN